MKRTALTLLLLLWTALSAISQTGEWLPVEVNRKDSILTIDSVAVYRIAENKRQAVACYRDIVIMDSIRCTQVRMIGILEAQVGLMDGEIMNLTMRLDEATEKAQRLGRSRITYALLGALAGVTTYMLIFK